MSFQRLESALYSAEARQRVIANNIANAETPNYKRSELLFEELVANAMNHSSSKLSGNRTDERHIEIGKSKLGLPSAQLVTDHSTAMNSTINNNVDLEAEMSLLAKNQMNYQLYAQQVTHEITMKKLAITGR